MNRMTLLASSLALGTLGFGAIQPAFFPANAEAQTPNSAAGAKATISSRDCKRLVGRSAAVGAEYKPGVDVRGRKVAGADLGGGSPIKLPKEFTIPIGVDFAKRFGTGDSGNKFTSETTIGKVTVRGSKVYYNGKPIGGTAQAELAETCKALIRGVR